MGKIKNGYYKFIFKESDSSKEYSNHYEFVTKGKISSNVSYKMYRNKDYNQESNFENNIYFMHINIQNIEEIEIELILGYYLPRQRSSYKININYVRTIFLVVETPEMNDNIKLLINQSIEIPSVSQFHPIGHVVVPVVYCSNEQSLYIGYYDEPANIIATNYYDYMLEKLFKMLNINKEKYTKKSLLISEYRNNTIYHSRVSRMDYCELMYIDKIFLEQDTDDEFLTKLLEVLKDHKFNKIKNTYFKKNQSIHLLKNNSKIERLANKYNYIIFFDSNVLEEYIKKNIINDKTLLLYLNNDGFLHIYKGNQKLKKMFFKIINHTYKKNKENIGESYNKSLKSILFTVIKNVALTLLVLALLWNLNKNNIMEFFNMNETHYQKIRNIITTIFIVCGLVEFIIIFWPFNSFFNNKKNDRQKDEQ